VFSVRSCIVGRTDGHCLVDANARTAHQSSNFLKEPFFLLVSTIRSEDVSWMVDWDSQSGATAATLVAWWNCPPDCPCDAPKQRFQSQRQPTRSIGEVENSEGFTRKTEVGREADFRLANRRLQPLGHLTADAKCT